ncbi:erythromycin esterase family protein, partial [Actinomadura adrarensis]
MANRIKDSVHALDTASVMGLFPSRPRLLALGEPTHGDNTLLQVRNELFRRLIEQEGYRTIALESDCLMGLAVDDHIASGKGDLDEVMERGFSHEWGAFSGNRELVRWMRARNRERPRSERLRFAGFDG